MTRQRLSNSVFRKRKDFNLPAKLFLTTIYAFYYASRFLGIACFSFDFKGQQAIESAHMRLYSAVLFLFILLFMPFAMHILYNEMTFLRQNQLLTYVGNIRYCIVLLCALATLYMQMFYRKAIMHCVNVLMQASLTWLKTTTTPTTTTTTTTWANKRVIWQIMAKCLTIVLQFMWIIFLILNDKAMERFPYFFTLLYVQYCQLIMVITLNLLFFGCFTLSLITQELNCKLRLILKQLKGLTYHRSGHHQQQLQSLSVQLAELFACHRRMHKLCYTLLTLYGWQLLCFLTFVIIECVTQVFIMYFVAADVLTGRNAVRNSAASGKAFKQFANDNDAGGGGHHKRVIVNPFASVYVFGIIWDMFLILLMIDRMRRNFLTTRSIFCQGIFLKSLLSTANYIIDQQLASINLYLLHLQTRISFKACGLFVIDKHLILRLLETIFLYLLLLIQFDLVLN